MPLRIQSEKSLNGEQHKAHNSHSETQTMWLVSLYFYRCKREAKELFAAGEEKWGTDEETFIRIFAMRNYYELRMIWNQYVKVRLSLWMLETILGVVYYQRISRQPLDMTQRLKCNHLIMGGGRGHLRACLGFYPIWMSISQQSLTT